MTRALELARQGEGFVEPNPMVGCVIVRNGAVIGEGWHKKFGGPHAEVEALADCRSRGHDPAGADVYVTLEPCCHHGKTPPCVNALIAARVGRVIAAMIDPFPQVSGGGVAKLREAGITVEVGLCEMQARRLLAPFAKRVTTGLPFVIAKWAQSIDGRIATRTGDSKWISSGESRVMVHELRGRVDAIVVGINTVLADDPVLTARDVEVRRIARRVVIDPSLKIPMKSKLVQTAEPAHREGMPGAGNPRALSQTPPSPPVLIAADAQAIASQSTKVEALRSRGIELFPLTQRVEPSSLFPLKPLLTHLANDHRATNVLIEGGGRLLGAAFAQDLVDQAIVFLAPRIFGDDKATPAVTGLSPSLVAQALSLNLIGSRQVGPDVLLDYRRA